MYYLLLLPSCSRFNCGRLMSRCRFNGALCDRTPCALVRSLCHFGHYLWFSFIKREFLTLSRIFLFCPRDGVNVCFLGYCTIDGAHRIQYFPIFSTIDCVLYNEVQTCRKLTRVKIELWGKRVCNLPIDRFALACSNI